MGLFDSMCGESGLIIDDRQRLIPIVEMAKGRWMPLALPIAGTSDRGGTMDIPKKLDANAKRFVALGKTFAYADKRVKAAKVDLEAILNEIRGDGSGAKWNGKAVSFELIDEGIYEAILAAVTTNGATAWTRYARIGLGDPAPPLPREPAAKTKPPAVDATTRRLCEAILAAPADDAVRKVYVDHLLEREDARGKLLSVLPVLRKLAIDGLAAIALADPAAYGDIDAARRPALVELVRFLAWGTKLAPAHGAGQYFGYTAEDEDDEGAAEPYCVRARIMYADMPELLGAVDANEAAWRARGADD